MDRNVIRNILAEDCGSGEVCVAEPSPCQEKLVFESTEGNIPFKETITLDISGMLEIMRYKDGKTDESTGARMISVQMDSAVEKAIAAAVMKAIHEGVGNVSGGEECMRGHQSLAVPALFCNDEYLEIEKQGD